MSISEIEERIRERVERLWESGQPPRAMAVRPLMRVLGCTLDQLLPAVRA